MTAIADRPQAPSLAATTEPCSLSGASLYDLIVDLRTQSDVNLALLAGTKPLFDMIFNELDGDLRDRADRYSWLVYALERHMGALHDALDIAREAAGRERPWQGIALFNHINDQAKFDRAFGAYTMASCLVDRTPSVAGEEAFDRAVDVQTDAFTRMVKTPAWSPSDIMRKVGAIVKETAGLSLGGEPLWDSVMADLDRLARRGA